MSSYALTKSGRSHPLLEQVPLTVSPFISLPTATTLPYTYRAMPSTLPPSSTGHMPSSSADGNGADAPQQQQQSSAEKPRYVVSATGHAAHPDDIIASCRALQSHVAKLQADADAELRALEERILERELAEKRRVAPGWLDSEDRLLEPERKLADGMSGLSIGGGGSGGGGLGEHHSRSASGTGFRVGGSGGGGVGGCGGGGGFSGPAPGQEGGPSEMAAPEFVDPGAELDRALGWR